MSEPRVVVYGASGYTGKWVSAMLGMRKIPFIAAGRSKARLEEQLGKFPELQGADYRVVQVEHTEQALTALLEGRQVVFNLVGPFMQLGGPVVRAALAAGCHYLDATGEQDWMLHLQREYGAAFEARDLVLAPATSSMWNAGALVSELVLETPGIDSLDISYTLRGIPSVASTLSFMRMVCQPQYYLYDNRLTPWDSAADGVRIAVPGIHQEQIALPWSGGGESVWYAGDPRVRHCITVVTFGNPAFMNMVSGRMQEFRDHHQSKSPEEQERITNAWAMEIAPQGEPPREDLNLHRVMFTAHGRGRLNARSVVLHGVTGYMMTGSIAGITIDNLLRRRQRAAGFSAAITVVGHRHLLAGMQEDGVVGKPIDLIA
ncbi:hypothetical protein M2352_004927 [Azospirillum fermentarium]|uniref:DUF5938 domain-containing protein n=1 Tax=Azospirillum fermentarium TaxID=1233114 RepID=UPI002227C8FA|nr:DUF5938 domain-containing protein [Azospirillum fermentarium]MCW2249267.1 hypothetical protein [Azospirillum fermentarium]